MYRNKSPSNFNNDNANNQGRKGNFQYNQNQDQYGNGNYNQNGNQNYYRNNYQANTPQKRNQSQNKSQSPSKGKTGIPNERYVNDFFFKKQKQQENTQQEDPNAFPSSQNLSITEKREAFLSEQKKRFEKIQQQNQQDKQVGSQVMELVTKAFQLQSQLYNGKVEQITDLDVFFKKYQDYVSCKPIVFIQQQGDKIDYFDMDSISQMKEVYYYNFKPDERTFFFKGVVNQGFKASEAFVQDQGLKQNTHLLVDNVFMYITVKQFENKEIDCKFGSYCFCNKQRYEDYLKLQKEAQPEEDQKEYEDEFRAKFKPCSFNHPQMISPHCIFKKSEWQKILTFLQKEIQLEYRRSLSLMEHSSPIVFGRFYDKSGKPPLLVYGQNKEPVLEFKQYGDKTIEQIAGKDFNDSASFREFYFKKGIQDYLFSYLAAQLYQDTSIQRETNVKKEQSQKIQPILDRIHGSLNLFQSWKGMVMQNIQLPPGSDRDYEIKNFLQDLFQHLQARTEQLIEQNMQLKNNEIVQRLQKILPYVTNYYKNKSEKKNELYLFQKYIRLMTQEKVDKTILDEFKTVYQGYLKDAFSMKEEEFTKFQQKLQQKSQLKSQQNSQQNPQQGGGQQRKHKKYRGQKQYQRMGPQYMQNKQKKINQRQNFQQNNGPYQQNYNQQGIYQNQQTYPQQTYMQQQQGFNVPQFQDYNIQQFQQVPNQIQQQYQAPSLTNVNNQQQQVAIQNMFQNRQNPLQNQTVGLQNFNLKIDNKLQNIDQPIRQDKELIEDLLGNNS